MPKDRYIGCLLGAAIGDAVGTTNEFKSREECEANLVTDMVGGGPFVLNPGQWTDDTSMTLASAYSLIECRKYDPIHMMDQFLMWRAGHPQYCTTGQRCFDIGGTTNKALEHYANVRKQPHLCGPTDPNSAGNGSLMRISPIIMAYPTSPDIWVACSRLTHGATEVLQAVRVWGKLLSSVLRTNPNTKITRDMLRIELACIGGEREWCKNIFRLTDPLIYSLEKCSLKSTGYVIHTLECALWCFFNTKSYRDCILTAANLGGDTDTIASIAGQLAGAVYGVPTEWIYKLDRQADIIELASEIYRIFVESK